MGDDNVSPKTQNKIWPVLTGWLIGALSPKGSFMQSGRTAQVEVSATEKAKQKGIHGEKPRGIL